LLGASGSTQASQLPSRLGLIRDELENARVLLRGNGPVPGRSGAAHQAEPGLESAGSWPSTPRHSFIAW
jgi:hypothetical protein